VAGLAEELGMTPETFSRKINGTNKAYFTNAEIKRIILTLVKRQSIHKQSEVFELLALAGVHSKVITPQEWQATCLNELEVDLPKPQLIESQPIEMKVKIISNLLEAALDELERKSLEKQLEMTQRNLNHLEEQAAGFGLYAPPYIKIGIEDGEKKVAELRRKLGLPLEDSSPTQQSKPITSQGYGYQEPERSGANTTSTNPTVEASASSEKLARTKVFVSYSHKDTKWLQRLQVHLSPLERSGLVELWDDTQILPGMKWFDEIKRALDSTKVAVLLVSADFLASKFIAEDELPQLLKAAEIDGAKIMPIIVGPSLFSSTPSLYQYQAVNNPSRPLSKMNKAEQEKVFLKLVKTIIQTIQQ